MEGRNPIVRTSDILIDVLISVLFDDPAVEIIGGRIIICPKLILNKSIGEGIVLIMCSKRHSM